MCREGTLGRAIEHILHQRYAIYLVGEKRS